MNFTASSGKDHLQSLPAPTARGDSQIITQTSNFYSDKHNRYNDAPSSVAAAAAAAAAATSGRYHSGMLHTFTLISIAYSILFYCLLKTYIRCLFSTFPFFIEGHQHRKGLAIPTTIAEEEAEATVEKSPTVKDEVIASDEKRETAADPIEKEETSETVAPALATAEIEAAPSSPSTVTKTIADEPAKPGFFALPVKNVFCVAISNFTFTGNVTNCERCLI